MSTLESFNKTMAKNHFTEKLSLLGLSKEAHQASKKFGQWYFKKYSDDDMLKMHQADTWGSESEQARLPFHMFGEDLVYLWRRFELMSDYEKETVNSLRDNGSSIPDLVDYIRAEPGFNEENKPIRTDVASDLRKKEFLEKSKRIESTGRSAALAVGGVAFVAVAATLLSAGSLPALVIPKWVGYAWTGISTLFEAAAGGGALFVAWKAWSGFFELKKGSPKISLGDNKDFEDLPNSLGALDYYRFNEQFEAFPEADKHLIKHLSSTEIRMFFNGNNQERLDATRLHILRANPPPASAKIQAKLQPIFRCDKNLVSQIFLSMKAVISAPWNREKNNARIPDLKDKMEKWRSYSQANKHIAEQNIDLDLKEKEDRLNAKVVSIIRK